MSSRPSIKPKRIGLKFWLWVKPVTSEFHKLPAWLRKWAGSGFIGAALAMVGIGEYAIAEVLLFLGLIAFVIQTYDWRIVESRPNLSRTIKAVCVVAIIIMLSFFAIVFVRLKGTKAWSNLLEGQDRAQTPIPAPAPSPLPTPSARPTLIMSPSPSPSVHQSNKRLKGNELKRRRQQALKDLDYRKP